MSKSKSDKNTNTNTIQLDKFMDDSFDSSTIISCSTDNTDIIPKRRRSVINGCTCDLDSLPERFILYKVEQELDTLIFEYGDVKFYDLDKYDWLKFKRTLKNLKTEIKQLKDDLR